jgi:hypothetical protein
MRKRLTKVGNSHAIILSRETLELLGVSEVVYTTRTPGEFQRPPVINAPSPEKAVLLYLGGTRRCSLRRRSRGRAARAAAAPPRAPGLSGHSPAAPRRLGQGFPWS